MAPKPKYVMPKEVFIKIIETTVDKIKEPGSLNQNQTDLDNLKSVLSNLSSGKVKVGFKDIIKCLTFICSTFKLTKQLQSFTKAFKKDGLSEKTLSKLTRTVLNGNSFEACLKDHCPPINRSKSIEDYNVTKFTNGLYCIDYTRDEQPNEHQNDFNSNIRGYYIGYHCQNSDIDGCVRTLKIEIAEIEGRPNEFSVECESNEDDKGHRLLKGTCWLDDEIIRMETDENSKIGSKRLNMYFEYAIFAKDNKFKDLAGLYIGLKPERKNLQSGAIAIKRVQESVYMEHQPRNLPKHMQQETDFIDRAYNDLLNVDHKTITSTAKSINTAIRLNGIEYKGIYGVFALLSFSRLNDGLSYYPILIEKNGSVKLKHVVKGKSVAYPIPGTATMVDNDTLFVDLREADRQEYRGIYLFKTTGVEQKNKDQFKLFFGLSLKINKLGQIQCKKEILINETEINETDSQDDNTMEIAKPIFDKLGINTISNNSELYNQLLHRLQAKPTSVITHHINKLFVEENNIFLIDQKPVRGVDFPNVEIDNLSAHLLLSIKLYLLYSTSSEGKAKDKIDRDNRLKESQAHFVKAITHNLLTKEIVLESINLFFNGDKHDAKKQDYKNKMIEAVKIASAVDGNIKFSF